jgi:predicted secreted protein with PEFG-CTERM motif
MKLLLLVIMTSSILSIGMILPIYAQLYPEPISPPPNNAQQNQVQLTDKGSIKVGFYTDPQNPNTANQTKFSISFVNKDSNMIQQHIDYKVFIKKGTDQIGGVPFTHTATGSITVPFQFTDVGTYQVVVEVDGILFQPIPPETATFTVGVESSSVPEFPASTAIVLVIGITSIIALSARSRLIPTN